MNKETKNGTISLLVFSLAGQRYALPVSIVDHIAEMVWFTPLLDAPLAVQGVVNLHGRIIPLIDMRTRLRLSFLPYHLQTPILFVSWESFSFGLIVDEVTGLKEIEREKFVNREQLFSIQKLLQEKEGKAAVPEFIQDGEQLIFVVDIASLFQEEELILVQQLLLNQVAGE